MSRRQGEKLTRVRSSAGRGPGLRAVALAVAVATAMLAWGLGGAVAAGAPAPWQLESTADPAPSVGTNPLLEAVSCAGTSCAAVGWYANRSSGYPAPMAQVFNGTTWRLTATPPAPSGNSSTYAAVYCAAPTSCLAVGSQSIDFFGFQGAPMAMRWDGTAWTELSVPRPPGSVSGFSGVSCPATTTCMAVGDVFEPTAWPQTNHPVAALWDHGSWTYAPVPVPAGVTYAALAGVSCPTVNRCTAVGSYSTPGFSSVRPLVEQWDGTRWTQQAVTVADSLYSATLSGVSCPTATSCTAVGSTQASTGSPSAALVQTRTGSTWRAQTLPSTTPTDSTLASVSCRSTTDCVAVGGSGVSTTRGRALALQLHGRTWRLQATAAPATNRALADVSCTTAGCHAVGWTLTDPANLVYSTLAEHHA